MDDGSYWENQHPDVVVLDASQDWKMIKRISLNIGRKHYHATSVEDLLALDRVKEGDRVVVIMAKDDLEQEQQSTEFQVIAKYTCCLFI